MLVAIKAISEELKEDGSPKHIEWTAAGADGKDIKVKLYPAIQVNEKWIHFEDRWDEFKNAFDKTYDIERANIKVEKGYWKPVTEATEVKNVFKKEALREVQKEVGDTRSLSIEQQVIIKALTELWIADKLKDNDPLILALRVWCAERLGVTTKVFKPEDKPEPTTEQEPEEKVTNAKELMAWAVSHGREFTPSWVRKELGFGTALITDEKAQAGYEALKVAMSW